jgi:hypothetical protein
MTFLFRISLFFILSSCISQADLDSTKLSFFNSGGNKTFSFAINEDFIRRHIDSRPSSKYSGMTKVEYKLLVRVLGDKKYCINKNGELSFKITSKQERVYDATFPSLIETNYRAKPIIPTTYFGKCL